MAMGTIIRPRQGLIGRGTLVALVLVAGALRPVAGMDVPNGGDPNPSANTLSLRDCITGINAGTAGYFPPLRLVAGNYFIDSGQGALPALTKLCEVQITADTNIFANGVAVFTGTITNVNSAGQFNLYFNDCPQAIGSVGSTIRRVRIDGNRAGGITINNGSGGVLLQAITILGVRSGNGIDATSATGTTLQGICLQSQTCRVSAGSSASVTSLAAGGLPGSFSGTPTAAATAGAGVAWNNPANAETSNNAYANTVPPLTDGTATNQLRLTGFGFNILPTATITGITVLVERHCDGPFISDNTVRLLRAGVPFGGNLANPALWPQTNDAVAAYNFPAAGWTATDLNNVGFGLALAAGAAGGDDTPSVDAVTIQVTTVNSFPAARLHNFIGYNGNNFWNAASPIQFGCDYQNGFQSGINVGGIGLDITSNGGGVSIADTDVGNCNSHGIQITPGGFEGINVRRVHVGLVPEGYREDQLPVPNSRDMCRRVIGDGIRINGGTSNGISIGNAADLDSNFPDDAVASNGGSYFHEHKGGDLGVICAGAHGGAGIRIGIGDNPVTVSGGVNVTYCRSGADSTGDFEVPEGQIIAGNASTTRQQATGLFTNANASGQTVTKSQFSGNTFRGMDLNGTGQFAINDNIVGLNSDSTSPLWYSEVQSGAIGPARPPMGNGTRTYIVATNLPGSAAGQGAFINIAGPCVGFYGNVISGSATDGLVMTANVQGTGAPGNSQSIGDGTPGNWNYIGTCGRHREGGYEDYAASLGFVAGTAKRDGGIHTGHKLLDATDAAAAATAISSDAATGAGEIPQEDPPTNSYYTPRVRGNGTTVYGGTGSPNSAVGDGFIYQGNGAASINGITVSDSARNGLVIDTPQGGGSSDSTAVTLVKGFIGVGGDAANPAELGEMPTDASLGNGTVGRAGAFDTIRFNEGVGVQIKGNGDHKIGVGSVHTNSGDYQADGNTAVGARNVISSNLLYGIQIMGTVGVPGRQPSDPGNSNITVQNNRIGSNLAGASAGADTNGGLGFGNGYQAVVGLAIPSSYPAFFGAGVRVEPNVDGRHIIGGDDGSISYDDLGSGTGPGGNHTPGDLERNLISNNGLIGVWLRGHGEVCVVGNFIGSNAAGLAGLGGHQAEGVLIEQLPGGEFLLHSGAAGTGSGLQPGANTGAGTNMLTQYIGWLPFSGLPTVNPGPGAMPATNGGVSYYPNVIVNNSLWGVAVEDDANHYVTGNIIGLGSDGATAIPNGYGGGLPTTLALVLFPETLQTVGGVEVGALNNQIASGTVIVGEDYGSFTGSDGFTAGNWISGNVGPALTQYRNGVLNATNNFIGLDGVTANAAAPNSAQGLWVAGNGPNILKRNYIAGNGAQGICIGDPSGATPGKGTGNNLIEGNSIGLGFDGTTAVPNANSGILVALHATGDNHIGGPGVETTVFARRPRRNVISGNGQYGIEIRGPGANVVQSNFIGVNANGNVAPAVPNALSGIAITATGPNVIGGSDVDVNQVMVDGNVLSGNTEDGLLITAPAAGNSGNNVVMGNLIGLNGSGAYDPDADANTTGNDDDATLIGVSDQGNTLTGLRIASDATLGTALPQGQNLIQDNFISGNDGDGVFVEAAGRNTFRGNRIGTNMLGTAAVPNGVGVLGNGIDIAATNAAGQFIGVANSTAVLFDRGNLISGNLGNGLVLNDAQPHLVYGNHIGLDLAGSAALPNGGVGVLGQMTANTATIGGTLTGQTNVVSGNTGPGVQVTGPANFTIRGNWVGLNAAGDGPVPNSVGLHINGTGACSIAENRISGNAGAGVQLTSGNNTLTLNRIGTNVGGDAAVPNGGNGVLLDGPVDVPLGARDIQAIGLASVGNVISGNIGDGVNITGLGDYSFLSNLIGQNVAGNDKVANGGDGIEIAAGSGGSVLIGGVGNNEQNSIGGNAGWGILHAGDQAPVIINNRIGTNSGGTAPIGNSTGGVRFASATFASQVLLGATYDPAGDPDSIAGNLISGNGGVGVQIAGACAHPVQILGNRIGTTLNGAVALGQLGHGVEVEPGNTQANVIGNAAGGGNVISGNGIDPADPAANPAGFAPGHGVFLQGSGATTVTGNDIGCDSSGAVLAGGVGNIGDGVRVHGNDGLVLTGNVIRGNRGNGVGVLNGENVSILSNRNFENGAGPNHLAINLDQDGAADPDPDQGGLPILLDGVNPNDGALTAGRANQLFDFPVLERLVPGSGGTSTLFGTAPSEARVVQIYRAVDTAVPDNTFDPLEHHGSASDLLATVNLPGGAAPQAFSASLVGVAVNEQVTALAADATGNTSEFSRNIGVPSGANSTIAIAPNNQKANGTDTETITVTLRDAIATPLFGLVDVALNFSPMPGLQPPANPLPATNLLGQTTATITATLAGSTTVTATSGGATINAPEPPALNTVATFVTADVDPANSSFVADKNALRNNGTDRVTFTFTMLDANNQPLAGVLPGEMTVRGVRPDLSVVLPGDPDVTITQPTVATDANGQTTAFATGTVAQIVTFTGVFGALPGTDLASPVNVTFQVAPVDPSGCTLTAAPTIVAANDADASTLTLTVRNVDAQPVNGLAATEIEFIDPATLLPPANSTLTVVGVATDANGQITATLRSGTVGSVTVQARVRIGGVFTLVSSSKTVQFTADAPSSADSTLNLTPATAVADGVDVVTATIVVKDSQGRVKPGEQVALLVNPTAGISVTQPPVTNGSGVAVGTLTATEAGTYDVWVNVGVGAQMVTFPDPKQQVVFTPNPPDAGRSTVRLSSSAIVADGAETSTLTITLIDQFNRPLAGVQPGEIVVTPAPAAGINLAGPATATDGNGITRATITGTTPADVIFTVTARGVQLTEAPQLTLRDFVNYPFIIGTHLMGVGVEPINPAPDAVFDALLPNLHLARYLPQQQQYLFFVPGVPPPTLDVHPGKGFWLQLNRDFDLRVIGTRQPAGNFTLATAGGWNMLANPFTGELDFRLSQIQVFSNGLPVGNLTTDAAKALVDPYAWMWDPVLGYLLVLDPATAGSVNVPGVIPEGRGIWMLVHQPNVTLQVTGPQRSAGRSARSASITPSQWMLSLQAESGGQISRASLLGVGSSRMLAALPPQAPLTQKVSLWLKDDLGKAVGSDVRVGPLTRPSTWTAVVNAPADQDVSLSWPGANRGVPAHHQLWLVDTTTGKRMLMNSRAAYSWKSTGQARELQVTVDPRGKQTLSVTDMSVTSGGSRSRSLAVTYTLTSPAEVKAVVRGLGGTVVRRLTGNGATGQNQLAWDRRDDRGRTVPNGVYSIELTAIGPEGEVTRVTRQAIVN